jgi:gluconate 5-dehydrogenase
MMSKILKWFDLTGQVALVTGGSRGLGWQMASALGEAGAHVVICARKQDELNEAEQQLKAQGIAVSSMVMDVTDFEALPQRIEQLVQRFGRIDILLNNAGTAWASPAETTTNAQWQKVIDLNLNALFYVTREVARQSMLPRQQGVVVNIASIGGLQGNAPDMKTISYNASKGAVLNLTRALASEWGPQGIRVNAICPGFIRTKMSKALLDRSESVVLAKTPLRRIGAEDDLNATVVYLASQASRHITGQHIVVDGGASTTLFGDMLGGA